MNQRAAFAKAVPGGYFLDLADPPGLTEYLRRLSWLGPAESVRAVSPAGAGNMNLTVRVATDAGDSFILKQSRPWVEKYPRIAAPVDRALQEGAFYGLVSREPGVAAMMPRLLALDRLSRLLMLEDLGPASDYTTLYSGTAIGTELDQLMRYLAVLHTSFRDSDRAGDFQNRAMRALNHQHIFEIPLAADEVELDAITPGLLSAARALRSDQDLVAEVARLGELYLTDGPALLHGDFFPGSWVQTADAVRVIDPEFSFFGPPEFDVGVMLAHLLLSRTPPGTARHLIDVYEDVETVAVHRLDRLLVERFAGVELIRRLIGVAQLPLTATWEEKQAWLTHARSLVTSTDPGRCL